MKKFKFISITLACCFIISHLAFAQPPVMVIAGKVALKDGSLGFMPKRYLGTVDSLDQI